MGGGGPGRPSVPVPPDVWGKLGSGGAGCGAYLPELRGDRAGVVSYVATVRAPPPVPAGAGGGAIGAGAGPTAGTTSAPEELVGDTPLDLTGT